MEIASPRTACISLSGKSRRLRPSNVIVPAAMRPGGFGTSRMMESDVTDLPQPDSPTMPSVSPGASTKLTPSTAANTLPPERNSVRSPLTSRRAGGSANGTTQSTGRDWGRRSLVP